MFFLKPRVERLRGLEEGKESVPQGTKQKNKKSSLFECFMGLLTANIKRNIIDQLYITLKTELENLKSKNNRQMNHSLLIHTVSSSKQT